MAKAGASWHATVKAELGVAPSPVQNKAITKRETRAAAERKANRRQKARRWTAYSGEDALSRKINARLERLECTNFGDALDKGDATGEDNGHESEDYSGSMGSASDDSDGAYGTVTPKKRKAKGKRKAKAKVTKKKAKSRSKKTKVSNVVKRRRVRSLADILLNENADKLSKARSIADLDAPDYITATAAPSKYPKRKICVISGQIAKYTDGDSSLSFADLKSYNTLKEQPPPWVRSSGNAPFFEALALIKEDRERLRGKLTSAEKAAQKESASTKIRLDKAPRL